MELGQTIQRVADLKFVLYRRPLHPELFHIHQSRHLARAAYQADIWVMGLSHVVTVQSNGRCLTIRVPRREAIEHPLQIE